MQVQYHYFVDFDCPSLRREERRREEGERRGGRKKGDVGGGKELLYYPSDLNFSMVCGNI